jgi:hypothetical protein
MEELGKEILDLQKIVKLKEQSVQKKEEEMMVFKK